VFSPVAEYLTTWVSPAWETQLRVYGYIFTESHSISFTSLGIIADEILELRSPLIHTPTVSSKLKYFGRLNDNLSDKYFPFNKNLLR